MCKFGILNFKVMILREKILLVLLLPVLQFLDNQNQMSGIYSWFRANYFGVANEMVK
jgi:hypothetical protein